MAKQKDVDATIQRLLERYLCHMLVCLAKETRRVTYGIYTNKEKRDQARQQLAEATKSVALLQEIVNDPKKYLYWDFDIYHNGFYDDGTPGRKLKDEEKEQSIGVKLQALGSLKSRYTNKKDDFDWTETDVIPVLSEAITFHFTPRRDPSTKEIVCEGNLQEKYETTWTYNVSPDLFYPESYIFDLSKYVNEITGTMLGAKIKYFCLPRVLFAKNYKPDDMSR